MNPLIFGKNETKGVISCEVHDDTIDLFIQNEDGSISVQTEQNKLWILCDRRVEENWKKLKGNLHYKYGKQFSSIKDFYDTKNKFGKKYDIYSIADLKEQSLINKGLTYYKGLNPKDISILSFDIETTGVEHNEDSKLLIISNTFRDSKGNITRKLLAYDDFPDEGTMVKAWIAWVNKLNPSILLGHNIFNFDLPYIKFIAEKYNTELNLGRDESKLKFSTRPSQYRVDGSRDQEYFSIKCYGREIVDTYFLALKYDVATKKYDSYGLKKIIAQEGLEDKNRQHYDASQIRYKYKDPKEWEKIKNYAEGDGDDALKLWDLMIPAYFYSAQSIPKSFQRTMLSAPGSQINSILVRSYLQEGHSIPKASYTNDYSGAISRGEPGRYSNIFKVDVASLYPSIMLEYDVYPKDKDPSQNFLKFLQYFTTERLNNKKLASETNEKYYKDLEQSQKIFINSAYGFFGTIGLNFNSSECADFITRKGREILEQAIKWAENKSLQVANCDTDSIAFCKLDQSFISKEERLNLLNSLNSEFPEKIKFTDDGFYSKLIVLAAKNYIMLREDGKLTLKGSSLKSSTLEPALKDFINEMIQSLLNDRDDFVHIYHKYILEACDIKDIKRWASKKTISEKTLQNERTNEAKIRAAIAGTEYREGDKIWTYYNENSDLVLVENYDGKYHKAKMLKKVYKATERFHSILNEEIFKDYSLKRKNQEEFKELISCIGQ